jgi:hypothetical protein
MTVRLLVNPCDSTRYTSEYGWRSGSFHSGRDIGALKPGVSGDKIYAVDTAICAYVGYDADQLGWHIVLAHDGYCTMYCHLEVAYVRENDVIHAGQIIGLMDNTGHSFGAHLHFEIRICSYSNFWLRKNGKPVYSVDPKNYLLLTGKSTVVKQTTPENTSNDATNPVGFASGVYFPYTDYTVDKKTIQAYGQMFGRQYKIIIENTDGTSLDISDLHCTFKCKRTMIEEYAISTITIYNLSPATENEIIMHGKYVIVEAGYEGLNYGVVFTGNIVQPIRSKENGVDYVLQLIAVDSEQFLSSEFANLTIDKGKTMRDAVVSIASKAKNPISINSISEDYATTKYTRGKVVFGKANDFVKQMAKSKNALYYINDGGICLTQLTDVPAGQILSIDYDSGMIGAPTQTEYGIEVTTLLNPQLKCNMLIRVDKTNIVERQYQLGNVQYNEIEQNGIYRIIEVEYEGDTRGTEWYCNLTTITQSGAFPSILKNPVTGSVT